MKPASLRFRVPPGNLCELAIESSRLRLAPLSEAYTEEIFRSFTPEITRYMLPAPAAHISETRAFIATALVERDRGDDLHFVICRRSNGEFLGVCGLHGTRRRDEPELGIWLKAEAHGSHYGREAIVALSDWAAGHLEFSRLIYPVDRRNIPSRKIAEALGGAIIDERKVVSMSGAELDEVIYGIEKVRR